MTDGFVVEFYDNGNDAAFPLVTIMVTQRGADSLSAALNIAAFLLALKLADDMRWKGAGELSARFIIWASEAVKREPVSILPVVIRHSPSYTYPLVRLRCNDGDASVEIIEPQALSPRREVQPRTASSIFTTHSRRVRSR